jgi:predicted NAD/FAD-binding protein
MSETKLRIAVIGGGVAGIVASYLLSRHHEVTLIEKNAYVGGHTNTVLLGGGPDEGKGIDTGFIVLNDKTYPFFSLFLKQLGVAVRFADMSFSVFCEKTGLQYASRNFNALFAQRRNLLRPAFLGMLTEMPRFWRVARAQLDTESHPGESLAEFLARHKFSSALVEDFIKPLGAAIWSSPAKGIEEFPANTFLKFFENHGWLSYSNQPRWQTVIGGSHVYVHAFRSLFKGTIVTGMPAVQVLRSPQQKPLVLFEGGRKEVFDKVVLAAHADESLALLGDPSAEERALLGAWSYSRNPTYLHTDESFLPPLRRAWASWNYRREIGENGSEPVSVTYDMTHLQGLSTSQRYLVTLNPRRSIREDKIIKAIDYTHPVYSPRSVASQPALRALSGTRDTYYCGSYFGYGFHEDAVASAVEVARRFSISL